MKYTLETGYIEVRENVFSEEVFEIYFHRGKDERGLAKNILLTLINDFGLKL